MSQEIIKLVEQSSLKEDVPQFEIGDTVDVHTRILEGDKERIQVFTGVVIARSGSGSKEMFTVRRIVDSQGVERKFPIHSPRDRQGGSQAKRRGASCQAVLPPRTFRQGGPPEGTSYRSGQSREISPVERPLLAVEWETGRSVRSTFLVPYIRP